jgi:hypothetical protein
MKHFILSIGLLVFSLGMAGAQQTRSLEKDTKAESTGLQKAANEDNGPRVSEIQVGDLYADGNKADYLKYVQTIIDYAAEFEYYIQAVRVKNIASLREGNQDGYKNTLRIEETVLSDDTRVVSIFAQLKTMEVEHYFSNKPFNEPHVRKVGEVTGPVVRTMKAREVDTAIAQQRDAWNKYFDNVYKGAITELQAAQKIMGRKRSPLLDNINRDIALLEKHKKDHSLFYSKN